MGKVVQRPSCYYIQLLTHGNSTTCFCFKSKFIIVWNHLSSLPQQVLSAGSVILHVFAFKQ